jgi:hypothetical protein
MEGKALHGYGRGGSSDSGSQSDESLSEVAEILPLPFVDLQGVDAYLTPSATNPALYVKHTSQHLTPGALHLNAVLPTDVVVYGQPRGRVQPNIVRLLKDRLLGLWADGEISAKGPQLGYILAEFPMDGFFNFEYLDLLMVNGINNNK